MNELNVQGLGLKREGEWILHPFTLGFELGSFNVLLGRTNAGKTSLMRVLAGLERPSVGAMTIGGEDLTKTSVRERDVAMVYQEFINYPSLTVYENIASPLRVKRFSKGAVKERVEEVAKLLKLSDFLNRKPKELSGGQQQRVSLARALTKEARFIFLDEPFVNLDYKLREELRSEIKTILKAQGATVFYATTDPMEPLFFDDYVLLMKAGEVLQYGKAHEVYQNPETLSGIMLYDDPPVNVFTVEILAGKLKSPFGKAFAVKGLADGMYRLALRPQEVLTSYHSSVGQIRKPSETLDFKVTLSEVRGSQTLIHLEREGKFNWTTLVSGVHLAKLGSMLSISFDWHSVYCFDKAEQRVAAFLT